MIYIAHLSYRNGVTATLWYEFTAIGCFRFVVADRTDPQTIRKILLWIDNLTDIVQHVKFGWFAINESIDIFQEVFLGF